MMRWTAIHEMGHACSLPGHYDKHDPAATEIPIGNKTCPMHYSEHAEDLQYIILQVLFKPDAPMLMAYGQFCKDDDFDCWGHLNIKDN
jgi:hypothetical protein